MVSFPDFCSWLASSWRCTCAAGVDPLGPGLMVRPTTPRCVCVMCLFSVNDTVASENGFRFLLSVQLSGDPFLSLLALPPCLFSQSNVPHSPAQFLTALLT
jgi:hypothetical protein